MAEGDAFHAVPMATFNSAVLTGTYAVMNTGGFSKSLKLLKVMNRSTVDVAISYDGTSNHDYISAGDTFILDLQTNNDGDAGRQGRWNVKLGQLVYGKGSAGTGNIYIVGYY